MIAEKMKPFVQNNSAIRMMFEEGNRLRAKYGADKVYDFSLGNPSVPAPDCVREAIIDLVNNEEPTVLHGYMSNAGFEDVRETIAQSLNRRFGTAFSAHNPFRSVPKTLADSARFSTIGEIFRSTAGGSHRPFRNRQAAFPLIFAAIRRNSLQVDLPDAA